MPRVRTVAPSIANSGRVPEELKTRLHPMWLAPDAIERFCHVHGLNVKPQQGPLSSFDAVVREYAQLSGLTKTYASNATALVHDGRVREVGIPLFAFELLVLEERGMLGRDLTPEDWTVIGGMETRSLARGEGRRG